MKKYGKKWDIVIPLDKCTTYLNTEKRRVYDIMNIFEGFGAVSRKAKNLYSWRGLSQISIALQNIQEKCEEIKKCAQFENKFWEVNLNQIDYTLSRYKFERVKSLGFLCEAFVCLFILWKPIIGLEEAAKKISKILLNDSQLKTKVRRLYDIANVLCVLKIVKKTLLKTGKPAFQWCGRVGIDEFSQNIDKKLLFGEYSSAQSLNSVKSNKNAQILPERFPITQSSHKNSLFAPQQANSPSINSIIDNLPLGINEQSLDLLEGILSVLRKRLTEKKGGDTK